MTVVNNVKTIRKLLETHRFRAKEDGFMQKCTGCVWIGWNHDQHVAEVINEAIETGNRS